MKIFKIFDNYGGGLLRKCVSPEHVGRVLGQVDYISGKDAENAERWCEGAEVGDVYVDVGVTIRCEKDEEADEW